jgi:NOL1/NOP2/sun family putative RNA methylase
MWKKGVCPLNLPIPFINKMNHLLGEEGKLFLETYNEPKTSGLRINEQKITKEEWEQLNPFQLTPIPFVPNGYYYDESKDYPGKHPYHAAGLYYIQEPSAMFVAQNLGVQPGEKVLDLCAAPGGKSTQLATFLGPQGLLVANEIHPKRVKALSENIERFGLNNTLVTNETPERLAANFPGYFDKILVDAPCSGEGMFRKDPVAIEFWSEEHVHQCALQQKQILAHAIQMLKPGGILVYSTCTFSPEENEQTIDYVLKEYPEMKLINIQKEHGIQPGRPDWTSSHNIHLKLTARLWPHYVKGEGHFVAKLQKTDGPEYESQPFRSRLKKAQLKEYEQFVKENILQFEANQFYLQKQHLYSLPFDCPDFSKIKVIRPGLHLGEMKKNRFEPNHAFALHLKPAQVQHQIDLSTKSDEWVRYLRGETLPGEKDRGWILMTIDGYSIGWAKEAKGTLKNFYPKGLRWMS